MSEQRVGRTVGIGEVAGPLEHRIRQRIDAFRHAQPIRYEDESEYECDRCRDTGKVYERHPYPGRSPEWCRCPLGDQLQRGEYFDRWWPEAVPRRFQRYTLDDAPNQEAASRVRDWYASVPSRPNRNLVLHGPIGTGKTGLAVGAMRAVYVGYGVAGRLWGVPDLLDRMRPGSDDDPMKDCQDALLLVLDDLGVEKPSEWVRERLYVLLNARYEAELPTIVTTNVNLAGLAESLGQRLVSRLAEDVEVVLVDGPDRRAR